MEYLYTIILIFGSFVILLRKLLANRKPNFEFIPTVGPSGRLTSYIGGLRFVVDARQILHKGYVKYPNSLYKVPTIDKWEIIANGSKLLDDIRHARDDELSFNHASSDNTQLNYTTKSGIRENQYHLKIVQTTLTSHFGPFCGDVHDEIVQSLADLVPLKGNEWTSVPALTSMVQVIARASSRVFVGLPLCRDPDYLALSIDFASSVVKAAGIINATPRLLQPLIGRLVSPYHYNRNLGVKLLGPLIKERLRLKEEHGDDIDYENKSNDLISWLVDEANGDQLAVENLVMRILFLNFAAIHTTSITLTHALFDLIVYPQYLQPLREEVEAIIKSDGWTKSAMARMYKLDSFLRESMRFSGLSGISLMRKVVSPSGFTFSNGVTLPCGAFVSAAADAIHHDEALYNNAHKFDGFRFVDMCNNEEDRVKYMFTSPSPEYLPFGLGKHACPGRFFAAHEIKSTLAYILINFDMKFKGESVRPENLWFAYACVPNLKAEIMFRKRQT